MEEYIKDNEGNLIEVTDLQTAIFQVAKYIRFLYDNPTKEQAVFFLKRQKYWKDIFIKLNHLKEKRELTNQSIGEASPINYNVMAHISEQQLLATWLMIGYSNYWIKRAIDPPFGRNMLTKCETIEELKYNLGLGNWCLGQGFYYQNLCFINQIDGGDEWLTIKDNCDFESITFDRIIKRGAFEVIIDAILNASIEDCKSLNY